MSRSHPLAAALALIAATSVGCGVCHSPVDEPDSTVPAKCTGQQPLIEPQKLDILFVIDNSGSMAEEQAGVAMELVAFIDEVKRGGGVSQDFHVGVVTTSVYQHSKVNGAEGFRYYPSQSGKLQAVPDASPDGGVVLGTGTERMLSGDDPELTAKFSRLVRQGTYGSGQETPFEAVRLALTEPLASTPLDQGGNGGFLRDRARLLIVVVTDEDDCSETVIPPIVYVGGDRSVDYCNTQGNSLTPVLDYHTVISEQLKDGTGAVREVVWATIGPVDIDTKQAQAVVVGGGLQNLGCPTSFGPGLRHRQMAEYFDSSLANLDSICKGSYRDTLVTIAGLANISQTLEVTNVPDHRLLVLDIIRRDGSKQPCTVSNGGISGYDEATGDQPARIHFDGDCRRRADDKEVVIRMLCAG
ncbi:MAG: vWA domain-containing protein [Myxococcaceae bacterium]